MSVHVYAPNVYLFAFHLFEGEQDKDRLFWDYYNTTLVPKFNISPSLELIDPIPQNRRSELWKDATDDNTLLFLEGYLSNQYPITGCVCPLLIYDSYALGLNLRIPELNKDKNKSQPVEIEYFQLFNPQNCLLPQSINSSLGQTILLTAWLLPEQQNRKKQWQEIAQTILTNFLGVPSQKCPPLYQSGHLFDNPIFEYGSPQYLDENGKIAHYIVWLFVNKSANENLEIVYQDFIDLFFYRNKITTAYQISLTYLTDIKKTYNEIKTSFLEISKDLPDSNLSSKLSTQELETFKQKLRSLPKLDLTYAEELRNYKNSQLTIKINQKNYTEKLNRIQEKFTSKNFSFFSLFDTKIALGFQQQIEIELEYFGNGSNLVDKAINSIRGLVEIEQAESDRQRQEADKDLQDHIQAIGVGIAAGAIFASNTGLITQPWEMPWSNQRSSWPHPFLIAFCLSVFCSWGAWVIAKHWINKRRSN